MGSCAVTPEPRRRDERDRLRDMVDRSLITVPLLERINDESAPGEGDPAAEGAELIPVVIDLNFDYQGGIEAAAERVRALISESITGKMRSDQGVEETKTMRGAQYVVARLEPEVILCRCPEGPRRWPQGGCGPGDLSHLAGLRRERAYHRIGNNGEGGRGPHDIRSMG